MIMDKIKEGQYFYHIHRRNWGVWQKTDTGGEFIKDFPTKEEAKQFVYEMNGWFNYK